MTQLTSTELIKDEQGIRSLQIALHTAEELGRSEDRVLAHVAPGEMVIPEGVLAVNPDIKDQIYEQFRQMGADPEQYVVGSPYMSINPITGQPEFGWFKKKFKQLGKVVKKVAPIAMLVPGVGTALGGVLGGLGGGITSVLGKVAPRLAGALGSAGSTIASGIAGLGIPGISSIAGGTAGGFGGIKNALTTKAGLFGGGPLGGMVGGAQPTEYTVQSGDTLSEIAAKNNTTVEALMKANGITDPNLIYAGSTLSIPGQGGNVVGNLISGQTGQGGIPSILGQGYGQPQGGGLFGGSGLETLLKLAAINKLRKEESKDPAEVVPVGADAFSAVGQGGEGSPIDYRVMKLQPALMPGVAYANVGQPKKMEHGGIASLEDPGDITPAWLEPGEFVMTKKATGNIGARNLYKMMKEAEGMG
jgi:LysM repeat protein